MTVLIDDRAGSKELIKYPPMDKLGMLCRLEFGDVSFVGFGPPDKPTMSIGIELKSTEELVSSIRSKRLQGYQIPGMVGEYDVRWLLYYGRFRADEDGNIQILKGRKKKTGYGDYYWQALTHKSRGGRTYIPYSYLAGFLCSPSLTSMGILTHHVETLEEAAYWLGVLYNCWQKPYNKHKSMFSVYQLPPPMHRLDLEGDSKLTNRQLSAKMQMVKVLHSIKGVGYDRALAVAGEFQSIVGVVEAGMVGLTNIKGIGKGVAECILKALTSKWSEI